VKLGLLLPTFRDNADDALEVARQAEEAGLDGAFAYDHLWPMGSPERPSLAPFPVLASVGVACPRLSVGPLVARVGLVSTAVLVEQYTTLEELTPGRVIAALGTGDHLSSAENVAYGLTYQSPDERRVLLRDALEALLPIMETWCGGGADKTNDLARELGLAINLWDVSIKRVREVLKSGPVTWAGPLGEEPEERLDELEEAGVSWVVAGPPFDIVRLSGWRRSL
jgi:alkanesulfonate monooxygenase SsuD/methylene tetrahydromethanopterin reductase-like flavin-dependent oxidoreductase (luciferase family)